MKLVIQRVTDAKVTVEGKTVGNIQKGLVVLVGIANTDTEETVDYLVKKMCGLRIFSDENDKMNLSLKQVDGQLLIISQFTLYADCKSGNRPSFTEAGKPELANKLYEYMIQKCKEQEIHVEYGVFGADMKVNLTNDGPVTIILEH